MAWIYLMAPLNSSYQPVSETSCEDNCKVKVLKPPSFSTQRFLPWITFPASFCHFFLVCFLNCFDGFASLSIIFESRVSDRSNSGKSHRPLVSSCLFLPWLGLPWLHRFNVLWDKKAFDICCCCFRCCCCRCCWHSCAVVDITMRGGGLVDSTGEAFLLPTK